MQIESQMSVAELAELERVYGVRLALPPALRRRVDAAHTPERQQPLPLGAWGRS